MKLIALTAAAALAVPMAVATPAAAADEACLVEGDVFDLDDSGVETFYNCMSDRIIAGYQTGDNEIAAEYRDWQVTATRAGVPGPHGNRFLLTYVNDVAAEQYLKYEEDIVMPVGSILAKESAAVRNGEGRVGPLFIMEKVDDAPDYGNWLYSGVQPNGQPLQISQSFCHDCHGGFDYQDSMGYPIEEIRVSAE